MDGSPESARRGLVRAFCFAAMRPLTPEYVRARPWVWQGRRPCRKGCRIRTRLPKDVILTRAKTHSALPDTVILAKAGIHWFLRKRVCALFRGALLFNLLFRIHKAFRIVFANGVPTAGRRREPGAQQQHGGYRIAQEASTSAGCAFQYRGSSAAPDGWSRARGKGALHLVGRLQGAGRGPVGADRVNGGKGAGFAGDGLAAGCKRDVHGEWTL